MSIFIQLGSSLTKFCQTKVFDAHVSREHRTDVNTVTQLTVDIINERWIIYVNCHSECSNCPPATCIQDPNVFLKLKWPC